MKRYRPKPQPVKLTPLTPAAPRRPTRIAIPLERSQHIPHNHPVGRRTKWGLVFSRPNTNGIFQPVNGHGKTVRGANEGWSYDDIQSFAHYLEGLEGTHP